MVMLFLLEAVLKPFCCRQFTIADAFIGYQSDTLPSMVLQVSSEDNIYDHNNHDEWAEQVKARCQYLLVQTATPDSIARLPKTALKAKITNLYFVEQEHSSLSAYLGKVLSSSSDVDNQNGLLLQVSTHSRLLSENDLPEICDAIGFKRPDVKLLHLQQFQTEQQFLKQVREFFIELANHEGILLVQCDSGDDNFNLIACTRHLLMGHRVKRQEMLTEKLQVEHIRPLHFIIIVQLPRLKGGCVNFVGFQGGHWESVHVDDLRPPSNQIPPIEFLIDRPISDLLKPNWIEKDQDLSVKGSIVDIRGTNENTEMEIDDKDELLTSDPVKLQTAQKSSKQTFDVIDLVRLSVQSAAGRLEDEAVLAKRTTDRIDLILNLLTESSSKITGGPSFAKSLHQKLFELLKEKKEKCSGALASYWVRKEALSGTRMHERGTFRKALQYKVLSEIEPLLAKVLAFADRDCNLNLLVDENQWLKSLWVHIFENKHLNEKYFDVSTSTIREHVNVSGRGKHVFKCCFPFSWLVKDMVDGLGRGGSDVSNRSCGTEEEKLRGILENSELKDILDLVKEEGKEEEAAERYLHDFVHMVYFPTKQCEREEIELVSRFIMMAAEKENDSEKYIFDIATIHVTFNRIKSRISNFNQMVQIEPDITRLLLNQRPMSIDVAALICSLEKLEPRLSELQSQEGRDGWCGKVLAIRSSIEEVTSKEAFSRISDDMSGYDEKEKDLLRQCWTMWQRLSAIRLFITHVCNTRKSENSRYLAKLCKVLGQDTNFLTTRSVHSLEKFLVECSRDFKQQNGNSRFMGKAFIQV
ncbi:E3 ubiquitin-protein ligase RNF213 [Exaiptasia diaphana]|nr:E3 ubiquitin-protein ligase RNF213 [Exaiptasia diaphana]